MSTPEPRTHFQPRWALPGWHTGRGPLDLGFLRHSPLLPYLAALLVGGSVAVTVLAGTYFVGKWQLLVAVVGGPAYVLLAFWRPELAILILAGITSGVVDTGWLPVLRVGPGSLNIPDIMLAVLVMVVVLRATTRHHMRIVPSPLNLPLFLFMGAVVLSMFNSIAVHDIGVNSVLKLARNIVQWMVFVPVVQLIQDRAALRRLVIGVWLLTALLAGGAALRSFIPSFPLHESILPATTLGLRTMDHAVDGVTRLFFPGERLLFMMIPVTIASITLLKDRKQKTIWLLDLLLLFLLAWLFISYQRNYWATTFVNCSLLFLAFSGMERLSLLKRLGPYVAFLILFFVVQHAIAPVQTERTVLAATNRVASLLTDLNRTDSSVQWRTLENYYALRQISRTPLIGIGIGNTYRPPMEFDDIGLAWYAHNAYLWITVMMGLVGLVPFLWLVLLYIFRSLRHWKEIQDPGDRAIYLGSGVAMIGAMISNLVAPNFIQTWGLITYPLLMGICEIIYRLDRSAKGVE